MFTAIAELAACIAESIICVNFMVRYFGFRSDRLRFPKAFLLFCGAMLCEILVTYTNIHEYVGLVCFVVIFTIISEFILKGKTFHKFLFSCLLYFVIIAINMIVLTTFSHLLTAKYSDLIATTGFIRIFILVLTKVLLFFLTAIILKFKSKSGLSLSVTEFILIFSTFLITASVGLSIREMLKADKFSPTLSVYIACCMIVLNVLLFIFLMKISHKNKKEIEMQLLKLQLKQQEKSMRETDLRYEETTTIRHDMKNYVSCALMLAENGEYDRLKEYLHEFSSVKLGNVQQYVKTESRVLNAVLNSKLTIASENDIGIDCVITGHLKEIREIDIGIMLSNLLDNAIEACIRNNAPSKISVQILDKESYLLLRIKNTYNQKLLGTNPNLQTTKSDKQSHGFGLKSIQDIVDKYSGSANFTQKNNEFIADIMLCNI